MWPGFDGRGYTREQWAAHVAQSPIFPGANGVVEHATGIPTLAMALQMNPANYIRNTQVYYENSLRWEHGPHLFADIGGAGAYTSRPAIWGFSSLAVRGTHDSCENYAKYGGEGMGNRNTEDYSSGPGAVVLDNQHFAFACLFVRMGLTPTPATFVPHAACAHDGHFQCPHENWERDWRTKETAAIVAFMNTLGATLPVDAIKAAAAVPLYPAGTLPLFGSPAWVQGHINAWIAQAKLTSVPPLVVDNDYGPTTRAAVWAFQAAHSLWVDGKAGPQTNAALEHYVA